MKKIMAFSLIFLGFVFSQSAFAQGAPDAAAKPAAEPAPAASGAPAAPAGKDAKPVKPEVPLPFWKVSPLPTVTGKIERRYDINRDKILQPFETTIFLRDVIDEVEEKTFYSVEDSKIISKYDKNKDGIINKFEAEDIKKDVQETE